MMTGIDDSLIGVPLDRAAAIVGVSRARLLEWGKRDILAPAHQRRVGRIHRWIYSFDEVVAGRVLVEMLDRGADIHTVAATVRRYRTADRPCPLASLRWAVDRTAKTPYVADDKGWLDGRQVNQGVLRDIIDLEEIRASVRRDIQKRPGRPGAIVRERGKLGSKPVFAGTRVPVESVKAWIRHGAPDDRILAAYPQLEQADLRAARRELANAG